jgi:hypothetical protein
MDSLLFDLDDGFDFSPEEKIALLKWVSIYFVRHLVFNF